VSQDQDGIDEDRLAPGTADAGAATDGPELGSDADVTTGDQEAADGTASDDDGGDGTGVATVAAGGSFRAAARRGGGARAAATTERKEAPTRRRDTTERQGLPARISRFVREVVAELRKVIWPSRKQWATFTLVVIVFLVIMVALVSGLDVLFHLIVGKVFG
jgi:preprotein translocase subunit SecE